MIHELNGVSCIPLEEIAPPLKGTAVTRSFGRPVTDYNELAEAVSTHSTRGAEKLRRHEMVAGSLTVFIHTNRYRDTPQYYNRATALIEPMTNDTRQGIEYGKAGIMLNDLRPESERPLNLFFEQKPHSDKLMGVLDSINKKHGRNSLHFAGSGVDKNGRCFLRAGHPATLPESKTF